MFWVPAANGATHLTREIQKWTLILPISSQNNSLPIWTKYIQTYYGHYLSYFWVVYLNNNNCNTRPVSVSVLYSKLTSMGPLCSAYIQARSGQVIIRTKLKNN